MTLKEMIYSMMELKNIRRNNRLWIILLLTFILFTSVSCTENGEKEQPVYKNIDYTIFPEDMKGLIKDKDIYITSIGQSSDMNDFKEVVLDNLNLFEYTIDSFLQASEVKESSVVIVFVGCSIKALAASETTIDAELERANEYVQASKNGKITLICCHTGGESRRGATSDQFITVMFKNSQMNIFTADSDNDELLTNLSRENNIAGYEITNSLELEKAMKYLYGVGI